MTLISERNNVPVISITCTWCFSVYLLPWLHCYYGNICLYCFQGNPPRPHCKCDMLERSVQIRAAECRPQYCSDPTGSISITLDRYRYMHCHMTSVMWLDYWNWITTLNVFIYAAPDAKHWLFLKLPSSFYKVKTWYTSYAMNGTSPFLSTANDTRSKHYKINSGMIWLIMH